MFAKQWGVKALARGAPETGFAPRRTGPAPNYMQAALFEAGRSDIVARPVFPLASGVAIPVKNIGARSLTFGRFELVGTMPGIVHVLVPGKTFGATMDGDRAFTLTGDDIGAGETIEVFVSFSSDTTEQGAVIARFNQS